MADNQYAFNKFKVIYKKFKESDKNHMVIEGEGGFSLTAKEYLCQLDDMTKKINRLQRELDDWRMLATSISVRYKDVQVRRTGDPDRLGTTMAKILDREKEIDNLIGQMVDLRLQITGKIDEIKDQTLADILTMRYVEKLPWESISEEIDKTWQWTHVLHKKALNELQTLLD